MPTPPAVTKPVAAPTVATAGLLLDQLPQHVASERAKVPPGQVAEAPVIAAVAGLTVATVVTKQPVPSI